MFPRYPNGLRVLASLLAMVCLGGPVIASGDVLLDIIGELSPNDIHQWEVSSAVLPGSLANSLCKGVPRSPQDPQLFLAWAQSGQRMMSCSDSALGTNQCNALTNTLLPLAQFYVAGSNDNTMGRFSDGRIVSTFQTIKNLCPTCSPFPEANTPQGIEQVAYVTRMSNNCGQNWTETILDATQIKDLNGSLLTNPVYAMDRVETYVDPWSDHLFLTSNTGPWDGNNRGFHLKADTANGVTSLNWNLMFETPGGYSVMTSMPHANGVSRVYWMKCVWVGQNAPDDYRPRLYFADNPWVAGKNVPQSIHLDELLAQQEGGAPSNYSCRGTDEVGPPPNRTKIRNILGNLGISRLSTNSTSDKIRVGYHAHVDVKGATYQTFRMVDVDFSTNPPTTKTSRLIDAASSPGNLSPASIYYPSIIQADQASPDDPIAARHLLHWSEIRDDMTVVEKVAVWDPASNAWSPDAKLDTWTCVGDCSTGDYQYGAFIDTLDKCTHRFFVPWGVQTDVSGDGIPDMVKTYGAIVTTFCGSAVPVNLHASDGTYLDKVVVEWGLPSGLKSADLFRNTTNNPDTASPVASDIGTSYEDKTANPGQLYYYWARAKNQYGKSEFSASDSGYRKLSAPTGVAASDGTYNDKVLITWKPIQGTVLYYTVVRKADAPLGIYEELGSTEETSFNDTTATPGLKYSYYVRAESLYGSSDRSKGDEGYRKLAVPTHVVASDADAPLVMDKVVISWFGVPGATSYTVYRATSPSSRKPTLLGTTTTMPYEDSTGTPEVIYYYFVKANNAYGSSDLSAPDTGHRALPAPTGVSASDGVYEDKVVVTWNPVNGATSYQVFRAESMFDAKTQLGTASARSTKPSFNDSTASLGGFYYYWVKAMSKNGISDFSDPWDTGYRKLPVPTGVSASDGTYTDKVRVTWNPVQGAAQYLIYRSTSSTRGQSDIGGSVTTTYDDTTALPGTTYYYWVCALWSYKGSLSDYSAPDAGWRGAEVPSPPTLLSPATGAKEVSTNLTFSWIASRGATSYRLQVATDSSFTKVVFDRSGITGTSQAASGLRGGGLYYWRVNATNTGGTSPWSEIWNFTTAR